MVGRESSGSAGAGTADFVVTGREQRLIEMKRRVVVGARKRLVRNRGTLGAAPEVARGMFEPTRPSDRMAPVFSPAAVGLDYGIREFSYYRGVLHVWGWATSPDVVAAVGYIGADGARVEIGRFPAEVRDGRRDFDFDIGQDDRERAMRTELYFELTSGKFVEIADIAAHALSGDPVSALNGRFQDLVRSLPSPRVLEVGARARSGNVYRSWLPPGASYVGFDILPGDNVDVVGDAHRLASCVAPDSFDAIYSVSTMEHLAMPWVAAAEMNRALKAGGIVFVATHQTWPVHDAPWDFYRFSKYSWVTLFNQFSGFEIIEAAAGEPAKIVANIVHPPTNGLELEPAFLSSAVLARKVGPTDLSWAADPATVVADAYPG